LTGRTAYDALRPGLALGAGRAARPERDHPRSDVVEHAGGVPEPLQTPDADPLGQAQEQVGRGLGGVLDVAAGFQRAAAAARED